MARQDRKLVSLRRDIWRLLDLMRIVLEDKFGRNLTIGEVVERSLLCLADAHKRGAWLSPAEAAPVFLQRHRDAVECAMRGTAAWQRENPTALILAITFDAPHQKVFIHAVDCKERNPVAEMEITPLLISGN